MLVNKIFNRKKDYGDKFFLFEIPLTRSNMGAGNKSDHHKQDANELYIAYKLQEELENKDKHITKDSAKKKNDYLIHCDISKITVRAIRP